MLGCNEADQGRALLGCPLWIRVDLEGQVRQLALPAWFEEDWAAFPSTRTAILHGFAPWITWYQGLLPSDQGATPTDHFGEEIALRLAKQQKKWWNRKLKVINGDIAALLEDQRRQKPDPPGDDVESALNEVAEQVPAPHRFGIEAGRVVAAPPDPHPSNLAHAEILLSELKRKAQEMLEPGNTMLNIDRRLARAVQSLEDMLPETTADLPPVLLRSRSRPIEKFEELLCQPDSELSVGQQVMLSDLAASAVELQACFPELRDLERQIAALNLSDPAKATQAGTLLIEAVAIAARADTVVAPSGVQALTETKDLVTEEVPAEDVKTVRVAEGLLTFRNFLSTVVRPVLETMRENPKVAAVSTAAAAGLIGSLFGPIYGIAGLVAAYAGTERAVRLIEKNLAKPLEIAAQQAKREGKGE